MLIVQVPLPARLQPFLQHAAQRFTQRVNQRNRRRVVVEPLLAPIIHGRLEIEIPALHLRLAPANYFFRLVVHGHRRQARRRADGLLRAAEANIDALAIDGQRHAGKRRDRVHHQQRAELIGNLAVVREALQHSCGSLAVRQPDQFQLLALRCSAHIFGIDSAAVSAFDADNVGRRALSNHRHALGENAVHANNAVVAGLERIQNRRFDSARARRGERKSDAIVSLEDAAQQNLHVAYHVHKPGIEMPHHRRSHSAIDARIYARRPGREH